jgi:hypothetical protein
MEVSVQIYVLADLNLGKSRTYPCNWRLGET